MGKLAVKGEKVQAYCTVKNKTKWRNAIVMRVVNEVYTVRFVGQGRDVYDVGKKHIRPFAKKEAKVPKKTGFVDLTKDKDEVAPKHEANNVADYDDHNNNNHTEHDPYYENSFGHPNNPHNQHNPYANHSSAWNQSSTTLTGNDNYYNNNYNMHPSTSGKSEDTTKMQDIIEVKNVLPPPELEPEPEPKVMTEEEKIALDKRMEETMNARHPKGFEEEQQRRKEEQEARRKAKALRLQRKKNFRNKIQMSVAPVRGTWEKIKRRQEAERKAKLAKRKEAAKLRRRLRNQRKNINNNNNKRDKASSVAIVETESDNDDDDDSDFYSSEEEEAPVQRSSRKRVSISDDKPAPKRKDSRVTMRTSPSPDSVKPVDMDTDAAPAVDVAMEKARIAREQAAKELEVIEIREDDSVTPAPYRLEWIDAATGRNNNNNNTCGEIPSCGLSLPQRQKEFQEQVRLWLEGMNLKNNKKKKKAATTETDADMDVEIVDLDGDNNNTEAGKTTNNNNTNNTDNEDGSDLPIAKRKGKRYNFRDRNAVKRDINNTNYVSADLARREKERLQLEKEEETLHKCQGIDYEVIHNKVWLHNLRLAGGDTTAAANADENKKEQVNTVVSQSSSRQKKGKPTRRHMGKGAVDILNRVDADIEQKAAHYKHNIMQAHDGDARLAAVPVAPLSCTCCYYSAGNNNNNTTMNDDDDNNNISGGISTTTTIDGKLYSVYEPWRTYKCSACSGGIHAWCAGRPITPLTAHVLCINCAERGRARFGIGTVKIPSLLCPSVEWVCRTRIPEKNKNYYYNNNTTKRRIEKRKVSKKKNNNYKEAFMSAHAIHMETNIDKWREGILAIEPAGVDITKLISSSSSVWQPRQQI